MSAPHPPSLYAAITPPGPAYAPFAGEARTDVAVIGGGIAGLSCALHLAGRGMKVTVLEANEIGWGASGRNGGQINPGLKLSPAALLRQFGPERGARLIALGGDAPDLVFSLIERHGIECAAARHGTLRAVKSAGQAVLARSLAEDYASHGAPVRYVDAAAVQAMTGTAQYLGALFDARGGAVNPLAYTRGLAGAAAKAGALIHTASPVTALAPQGDGWRLTLPGGILDARHVALCANAYQGGLWPGLAESMVPLYSMIAATAPLPPGLRDTVMPAGAVLYEQAEVTIYCRLDEAGRLLMGGRSPSRPLRAADTAFLRGYATRLWPQLRDTGWTHGWNGQLAFTTDHLPHVHEPAPGFSVILGCNGRGVALMTALGERLAARIATGDVAELVFPPAPVRRIPFHRFWPLGVALGVAKGRLTDWLSG